MVLLDCDSVATGRGLENEKMHRPPLERRSLLQELAAQGIRLTAQRKVLIDIIQSADKHLDAAALLDLAKKRDAQIDRATVYRTLELLKRLRLIDELDLMHLTGEKHFYEARTTVDHVHLACLRCGRIEEYTSPLFERLKAEISRERGFQIRVARLEVGGLCRTCSARKESDEAPVASRRQEQEGSPRLTLAKSRGIR